MLFGALISLLTFPGVIARSIFEQIFIKLADVKTVVSGSASGEDTINKYIPYEYSLLQLVGKLIFQFLTLTILALLFYFILKLLDPQMLLGEDNIFKTLLGWLGFSMGIHVFPTINEGKYAWHMARNRETNVGKGLWHLISLTIFGIAIIEYFWGSILYSVVLYFVIEFAW